MTLFEKELKKLLEDYEGEKASLENSKPEIDEFENLIKVLQENHISCYPVITPLSPIYHKKNLTNMSICTAINNDDDCVFMLHIIDVLLDRPAIEVSELKNPIFTLSHGYKIKSSLFQNEIRVSLNAEIFDKDYLSYLLHKFQNSLSAPFFVNNQKQQASILTADEVDLSSEPDSNVISINSNLQTLTSATGGQA